MEGSGMFIGVNHHWIVFTSSQLIMQGEYVSVPVVNYPIPQGTKPGKQRVES